MKLKWKKGRNDYQNYYDAAIGNDYLLVFENNWNPGVWMASINNIMIGNKTYNDRQRKKQALPPHCPPYPLCSFQLLSSSDPSYMMRKTEYCYFNGKTEITP